MSNINNTIYEFLVDIAGGQKIRKGKYIPTIDKALSASKSIDRVKSTTNNNGFNPLATSTNPNPNRVRINLNRFKKSLYKFQPQTPSTFSKFRNWVGNSSPISKLKNWYKSQFYDNRTN